MEKPSGFHPTHLNLFTLPAPYAGKGNAILPNKLLRVSSTQFLEKLTCSIINLFPFYKPASEMTGLKTLGSRQHNLIT